MLTMPRTLVACLTALLPAWSAPLGVDITGYAD